MRVVNPRPVLLIMGLLLVCVTGAAAFEGRYLAGTKAYHQEVKVKKQRDGGYSVDALVAMRGCAGSVEATGTAEGDLLTAVAATDDGKCTLTLKREKKGLSVVEEGCLYFHGASCEFSGDYRKR